MRRVDIVNFIKAQTGYDVNIFKAEGVVVFRSDSEEISEKLERGGVVYAPYYSSLSLNQWLDEFKGLIYES